MERSLKLGAVYNPLEIAAPPQGDVLFCMDGLVPYLRLKITAQSRSWVFDKSINGKHFKRRLGDANAIGVVEARLEAYNWAKSLDAGVLPETRQQKQRKLARISVTVETLFKEYVEKHLKSHASTASEIERGFELYWAPIRKERISDLAPETITAWMHTVARLPAKKKKSTGNATANKQLTFLKACIRWGAGQQMCEWQPSLFLAVKRLPEADGFGEYLKKEQVAQLETALEGYSSEISDAIMMGLWTSQRKSNVLSMEWSEIDFSSMTWTIPAPKTKWKKKDYTVTLTTKALEILMRRRSNGSRWVFPSDRSESGHIENINTAWLEIRAKADLGSLRIHGLRHTGATWLAEAGASAFEIQRRLQHSSVKTSERYVQKFTSNVDILNKSQEA